MSNWIETAEAALRNAASDADSEILRAGPPPILDAEGIRAVVAPFLAGFLWAATIFREVQTATPLDPLALLLRLLALALSVRALTLLAGFARRLRLRLRYSRYALVLTSEGLFYRTPDMDVAIPREDILDVRERGRWRDRGGRRFADVYVVLKPRSGRTHVVLPPVFERTPGVLAERLMRWLGPAEEEPSESSATAANESKPLALANEYWARVAAGDRDEGVIAIEHGRGWLQRGPYASVLLGIAVLEGFMRLPEASRASVGATLPLILVGVLVIVPITWFLATRRQIAPRLGLAMIFTPPELMLRMRAGVLRVAWPMIARTEIESRAAWSLLLGAHESRWITFQRKNAPEIRFHESFIAAPLEVVSALCDAYRKARIAS